MVDRRKRAGADGAPRDPRDAAKKTRTARAPMLRQGTGAAPGTGGDTGPAPVAEPVRPVGGLAVPFILAAVIFLAPAVGVPHEEMLQDTLKSIVVSLGTLMAAVVFFGGRGAGAQPLRWHGVMWLALSLMAYALGSMAWSHTYLAAVEAIRWFVFGLLAWLAMNTFSRERLPLLAWGVHAGAVVAALWAALQFWVDFRFFPQGPNPASTFVNRNFFAEYVVCTLPFSALLLARARRSASIAVLAASLGLVVVSILMTGTRSALVAMWLQVLLVLPAVGWRYRRQLALGRWSKGERLLAAAVLLGSVAALGAIPSGNVKLLDEGRGSTALARGLNRTGAAAAPDEAVHLRVVMWEATARMIRDRPLTGVGAGAWENEVPLYQSAGSQLETDYYVHNEFLQLLAEYGVLGLAVLIALLAYLAWAAWRTWQLRSEPELQEAAWRAALLCSVLALLMVSQLGFPWHMASTVSLFALALGALAASDARLNHTAPWSSRHLPWNPRWSVPAALVSTAALLTGLYITALAAECERLIVRATRIALIVSGSGEPNHPKWNPAKAEMLRLIEEGVRINPHYRKITPIVADELARWGDWKNATWIWESVISSRPNIVAILANVARGYVEMGEPDKAWPFLERARAIRPDAPSVRSLQVVLLARSGRAQQALALAREAIRTGHYDIDLLNTAFRLGWDTGDRALARQAMELRQSRWPAQRLEGYVQLAKFDFSGGDEAGALENLKAALALGGPSQRDAILAQVPAGLRTKIEAR